MDYFHTTAYELWKYWKWKKVNVYVCLHVPRPFAIFESTPVIKTQSVYVVSHRWPIIYVSSVFVGKNKASIACVGSLFLLEPLNYARFVVESVVVSQKSQPPNWFKRLLQQKSCNWKIGNIFGHSVKKKQTWLLEFFYFSHCICFKLSIVSIFMYSV